MKGVYGRKYRAWKTTDGKTLYYHHISPDKYFIKGRIITKKWCPTCREFVESGWFYKINNRLSNECKACQNDRACIRLRKKRRSKGGSAMKYLDTLITRDKDGLEVIPCRLCGLKINVNQLRERRSHDRLCGDCERKRQWGGALVRRVRKTFGEKSGEYLLAKNEKRHYHLKALCRLLGVVSHNGVRTKKKNIKVFRVLPKLSYPKISSKERAGAYNLINKWAKIEKETYEKGQRWTVDVHMLALRGIQV